MVNLLPFSSFTLHLLLFLSCWRSRFSPFFLCGFISGCLLPETTESYFSVFFDVKFRSFFPP